MLTDLLLVLAMRRGRPSERRCELSRGGERGDVGLHAAGQARGDLLEQPAVAVRIAERCQREVAAAIRIRTADPDAAEQVRLIGTGMHVVSAVKHLAYLHTTVEQLLPCRFDIRNDQI